MASETSSETRGERKPKLSERIISGLRERIVNGEIAPGQKLPTEGQLTGTLVSPAP